MVCSVLSAGSWSNVTLKFANRVGLLTWRLVVGGLGDLERFWENAKLRATLPLAAIKAALFVSCNCNPRSFCEQSEQNIPRFSRKGGKTADKWLCGEDTFLKKGLLPRTPSYKNF